jgi:predicted dehydrogenase
MQRIGRRIFLGRAAAGTGAFALAPSLLRAVGSNDTIRVAVAGVRGQGREHIRGFSTLPDVEVVALCDVDESILNDRAQNLEQQTKRSIARFADIRKLLEDKTIDLVSIATPNHWHSLMGIWSFQAGKDVYVEKPLSHNVWEGRQLVKAARAHDKMCQHGTQGRSCPAIIEAMQKLKEGVIGQVYMAKGLCYKWRPSIGKKPDAPVPPGVHYDLWLGPAPERPFSENRFHYNWHWHWDYGNGDIGNQGVHEMDMARWGLGVGLPTVIASTGGKFMFDDDQETPNVQHVSFSYPAEKKLLQFEVRHWITNHEGGFGSGDDNEVGTLFYGSEGYMAVKYFEYRTFLGKKREPGPSRKSEENRWATCIAGVRSRRIQNLGVDVEEGHLSSALCHLANIAYRLGRVIRFDPKTETCVGDPEANAMLRRDYRAPFVVPAEV